ncbi:LPS export ABC transporter periplasmic protein LptC [Candidatus Foliamicus sp.]
MIRKRKLFPALLVAGLALSSLVLTYRGENTSPPEQVELSRDYFFRDARMALTGATGDAALEIEAGRARRSLEDSTLELESISIRRGDPPTLALMADSALLPRQGADLAAEGNLRLEFGPSGTWMARAERARLSGNGSRVTLMGDVRFARADGARDATSITGEHLILDVEEMTASTDQRVRVRIGELVFEADDLNAQVDQETITLASNVQAIFSP